MKSVLILLSTYNGQKYLSELLNSLLSQKNVNVDILVRDDASNDSTMDILEKYHNEGKLDFFVGKNLGAGRSFFELIQNAPTYFDYYAFCDQDDVWLDDKLYIAVSKLEEFGSSKESLYYSGQIITDESLKILYNHDLESKRSSKSRFIFNQAAGCTMVFNNTLMEQLKKAIPEGEICHDVWTNRVCLMLDGNIVVDSKGYILYRQHGNNEVGLDYKFVGKIKRAFSYIFQYRCSDYAKEIMDIYADELTVDNKEFLKLICSATNSFRPRVQLLNENDIIFESRSLRIIFIIKVLIGQI